MTACAYCAPDEKCATHSPGHAPPMTRADLRDITNARARIERAQNDMRAAIVAAFENRQGHTVDDIAHAAGLTRERIYQIVKELEAR